MPRDTPKPDKETKAKIAALIDAAKAHVDALPPDQRAQEITRLAQQAAHDTATATTPELLARLDE